MNNVSDLRIIDPTLTPIRATEAEAFKIRKRRNYRIEPEVNRINFFCDVVAPTYENIVTTFGDDSDIESRYHISPLAEKTVSHFPVDESGFFSLATDVPFPIEAYRVITERWRPHVLLATTTPLALSIPRRKNTGWPFFISGADFKRNLFAIYVMTKFTLRCMADGLTLREIHALLRPLYGEPYLYQGERLASKDSDISCFVDGSYGVLKSSSNDALHLEGQARLIGMSGKIDIVYNRKASKTLVSAIQRMDQHTQDRTLLRTRINSFRKRFKYVLSLDQSKFDKRNGGVKAKIALDHLDSFFGGDNLSEEFGQPVRIITSNGVYMTTPFSIIPSGVGTTTAAGCFLSDVALLSGFASLANVSIREAEARLGQTWDYQNWGDDALIGSNFSEVEWAKALAVYGLVVTSENRLRFLGELYDNDSSRSGRIVALSSIIRNSLEPERPKIFPDVSTIACASRRQQLGDAALWTKLVNGFDLGTLMARFIPSEAKRPFFPDPSDRQVLDAVKWVEQNIAQVFSDIDSLYYNLTKGSDSDELAVYLGLDESILAAMDQESSWDTIQDEFNRNFPPVDDMIILDAAFMESILGSDWRHARFN